VLRRYVIHLYGFEFVESVVRAVERLGGQVLYVGRLSPYVVAYIPTDKVYLITTMSGVREVRESDVLRIMQLDHGFGGVRVVSLWEVAEYVGVPKVWGEGFKGQGVKVAVLDTGVDPNHPMLKGKVVKHIQIAEGSPYGGTGAAAHGTWVASAIAGREVTVGDYRLTGMAPNSSIVSIKVLNDEGMGFRDWILAGMEEAVLQGADVVNMSLGGLFPCCSGPEREIIAEGLRRGVVFVVAAGNSGPDPGTIACPGTVPEAVTVGSCCISIGRVSWFSSRGPACGTLKPTVVAPGGCGDPSGTKQPVERVLGAWYGGTYNAVRGTSMATPVVTGVLALVKGLVKVPTDIHLALSCRDIEGLGPDPNSGYGVLDASRLLAISKVPISTLATLSIVGTGLMIASPYIVSKVMRHA